MRRMLLAAVVVTLGGCPAERPPACATVDLGCAPLYTPTFDHVYANTLLPHCGGDRAACHAADGDAPMSLADPASAYASLLAGRVTPGDPGCSEAIVRISSPGKAYQMPIGDPLSTAEACSLIRWVAAGAPGPGQPLPSMWSPP